MSAKGNMTGSIWHYEAALNQQHSHVDALSMLHTMKCYQKYYRRTQGVMSDKDQPRSIHADSVVLCKYVSSMGNCNYV